MLVAFLVTSSTDNGNTSTAGTLSWAIDKVNNPNTGGGVHEINFSVSGGVVNVNVLLPSITYPLTTIDGSNFGGTTRVIINGATTSAFRAFSYDGNAGGSGWFQVRDIEVRNIKANAINVESLSDGDRVTVQNSVLHENTGSGIDIGDIATGTDAWVEISNNYIYGNSGDAVVIHGPAGAVPSSSATRNSITGNFIGRTTAGVAFANGGHGITLGQSAARVDVTSNAIENVTASGKDAIRLMSTAGTQNKISLNTYRNVNSSGLLVDLNDDGITDNDPGDTDPGPNNKLNKPLLHGGFATRTGGVWTIPVDVDFDESGNYQFQFYRFSASTNQWTHVDSYEPFVSAGVQHLNATFASSVFNILDRIAVLAIGTSGANNYNTSEFSTAEILTDLGDYDRNGVVNAGDHNLWKATYGNNVTPYAAADGTGDGQIGTSDYNIWRNALTAQIGAAKSGVLNAALQSGVLPKVAGVTLTNSSSGIFDFTAAAGTGEQLRSVPLADANSLSIIFNQGVAVSSSDFTLINLDGTAPSVASFAYDTSTQTATWTFNSTLGDGRYLIRLADSVHNSSNQALDGEFTSPWSLTQTDTSIFGSGNGTAGGEFRFRFTVLAGDTDHDNIDGSTNYTNWTSYEPGMIHVSTTTDEFDSDLSFGDVSLREAVNYANNATEPTIIDLPAAKYTLSLVGTEATANVGVNDLDIFGSVKIVGFGAGVSIIDNSALTSAPLIDSRTFDLNTAASYLELSRLTVANGSTQLSGQVASVANGATMQVVDSAIVNNLAYIGGTAILVNGGNLVVSRSVFSNNNVSATYGGAAISVSGTTTAPASIAVGESIFAQNVQPGYYGGSTRFNIKVSGTVTKANNGSNLFDYADGGFFDSTAGAGDYLGTPTYIVTSIADTFDHSNDAESLSLREAIDLANNTSGTQEIWMPAWNFTLTRDRGTASTDTDVSIGDLDITDSLIVRGVSGQTSIAWKAGTVDRVFELLGDYNRNGAVDSADYALWSNQNGFTGLPNEFAADGDDDGDVDSNDYNVWIAQYGDTFQLSNVDVFDPLA